MPQHKVTNELTTYVLMMVKKTISQRRNCRHNRLTDDIFYSYYRTLPTIFNKIRVKIGKPIYIDDLVAEYRKAKATETTSKDPMYISPADKRFWTEVTAR